MLSINPKWLFEKVGIKADDELTELVTIFLMRFNASADRLQFLKDCLKKALDRS